MLTRMKIYDECMNILVRKIKIFGANATVPNSNGGRPFFSATEQTEEQFKPHQVVSYWVG